MGYDYTVKWCKTMEEVVPEDLKENRKDSAIGLYDEKNKLIYIYDEEYWLPTLLHEVLHAISHHGHIEMKHKKLDLLASIMADFLIRNKFLG